MSTITWIVIVLIVISIGVTVSEVGIRFALLEREKGKGNGNPVCGIADFGNTAGTPRNMTLVRESLTGEEVQALCGIDVVGKTFAEL